MPHHVTQRGNRNAVVFETDSDRAVYLAMLRKAAERNGVKMWAYCLMSNHIHLVAVPASEKSLSITLKDTQTAYANWFNKQHAVAGHLWQGRFFSSVMDEPHLWAAVRYIERNPVRARICNRPEEYAWSSAAAHCGLRADPVLSQGFPHEGVVADWRAWLSDEDVGMTKEIRHNTRFGLPSANAPFVEGLGLLLNRNLSPGKRGRPVG
jgi:putative transposase